MILREEQTLVMPLGVYGSDRKKVKNSWFVTVTYFRDLQPAYVGVCSPGTKYHDIPVLSAKLIELGYSLFFKRKYRQNTSSFRVRFPAGYVSLLECMHANETL